MEKNILVKINETKISLKKGMRFSIYCEKRKDYLVPSEILELNDTGIVKLKILDETNLFDEKIINQKIVFGFPKSIALGNLISYL